MTPHKFTPKHKSETQFHFHFQSSAPNFLLACRQITANTKFSSTINHAHKAHQNHLILSRIFSDHLRSRCPTLLACSRVFLHSRFRNPPSPSSPSNPSPSSGPNYASRYGPTLLANLEHYFYQTIGMHRLLIRTAKPLRTATKSRIFCTRFRRPAKKD